MKTIDIRNKIVVSVVGEGFQAIQWDYECTTYELLPVLAFCVDLQALAAPPIPITVAGGLRPQDWLCHEDEQVAVVMPGGSVVSDLGVHSDVEAYAESALRARPALRRLGR